jgi:putative inorganic carbon (HCO3(-)) transporter
MTTVRGHTLPDVAAHLGRGSMTDRPDRRRRSVLSIVVVGLALVTAVGTAILGSPLPMLLLLVAALGIALVGRPEIATPIFAFVFYLNLPTLATRFHGVPTVVAVLFGLILVLPALKYILMERRAIVFPVPYGLMFAYLAAALTSTLLSADVESSALALTVFLSEGLLLYFLVVNVVRSTATLRQVIWALLLAGAVMGAISVWQETTQSYNNVLGGLAQVNQIGFGVGETISGKVVRPRLAGPVGEQNRYAQVLVVLVPLALFRFWGERRLVLRAAAGMCTLLIISGILLTFSRGAAVALAGLFLTMAALRYIRVRDLVVVGLTITILIGVVAPQALIRLDSLAGVAALLGSDENGADGAIVGRATSNLAALNAFLDHPIVGVGPGQYFRRFSQEYGNDLGLRHFVQQRRAHNLYFETAADLGIIGFTAFMAVIAATLVPLWRLRRRLRATRPDLANIAASFFLSVLGYLYTGVFLHLSYERYFWVLLALAAVAAAVIRYDAGPELVEEDGATDPRSAILAAAGALNRGSRGSRGAAGASNTGDQA